MSIKPVIDSPDLFSFSTAEDGTDESFIIENEFKIRESFFQKNIFDGAKFLLKSEAYRLKLAYAYNKILSLSNSRTRILAHQVESTHRIVSSLRQRYLIADEVGLGKTIEAGLVIKEMIYRHDYKRILIVCPASLMFQWQNEMESKFNEKFIIMDRKVLARAARDAGENLNPWKVHDRVICSLDFIKNKNFEPDLARCTWDAVVFDEAHRLRRDANSATLAYNMAEVICAKTKSLILLSATPFRGKLEELYYLVALVDKNLLGPFQSFYNDYCADAADFSGLKRKLDQVIIRRTKREVGGFTRRFARTIRFELFPDERYLYDETTRYVAEEFNRALQTENRANGFVMTVFQKLLDSSSHALCIALTRRSARLKEVLERAAGSGQLSVSYNGSIFDDTDIDECEELPDTGNIPVVKTVEELKLEIATLDRLVSIASGINANKKGEKLIRLIKDLKKNGHRKILIFTQFRTTQDYLLMVLESFQPVIFNGSMNRDQKEQAIIKFRDEADVLIATEAGGEGRNLQFCDVLINYDLPWSPLKIEQRIGRIHRFGQPNDVHIYNFSTRGTVAERVLEVLTQKLRIFEESIGTPDIMLGQIEDEVNLNTLFMEMASGRKQKKDVEDELSARMENARQSFEKLSELTVAGKMDFNYDEYYRVTLKDRAFTNMRIERFINGFMNESSFAGNIISRKKGEPGLYRIINHSEEGSNQRYGTFMSETALEDESLEFLAFGHEVVDSIINHCIGDDFGNDCGILSSDSVRCFKGIVFNFLVKFSSVTVSHEIFTVLSEAGNLLTDDELDIMENLVSDFDSLKPLSSLNTDTETLINEYDSHFEKAKRRLIVKINERLADMNENLEIQIDPELDKVKESYKKQIKELQEKLDLHEGQMKWYGRDMKSSIARTRNRILKAKKEMESLLTEYRGYYGIKYKARLIGAAVIISGEA
jgi:ERCC4-related helicase